MWKYFEFGPAVQGMLFKDISYLEIGGSFVQHREPFMQFLLEGIIRNNYVKLFCIWTSVSDVV